MRKLAAFIGIIGCLSLCAMSGGVYVGPDGAGAYAYPGYYYGNYYYPYYNDDYWDGQGWYYGSYYYDEPSYWGWRSSYPYRWHNYHRWNWGGGRGRWHGGHYRH